MLNSLPMFLILFVVTQNLKRIYYPTPPCQKTSKTWSYQSLQHRQSSQSLRDEIQSELQSLQSLQCPGRLDSSRQIEEHVPFFLGHPRIT